MHGDAAGDGVGQRPPEIGAIEPEHHDIDRLAGTLTAVTSGVVPSSGCTSSFTHSGYLLSKDLAGYGRCRMRGWPSGPSGP